VIPYATTNSRFFSPSLSSPIAFPIAIAGTVALTVAAIFLWYVFVYRKTEKMVPDHAINGGGVDIQMVYLNASKSGSNGTISNVTSQSSGGHSSLTIDSIGDFLCI